MGYWLLGNDKGHSSTGAGGVHSAFVVVDVGFTMIYYVDDSYDRTAKLEQPACPFAAFAALQVDCGHFDAKR